MIQQTVRSGRAHNFLIVAPHITRSKSIKAISSTLLQASSKRCAEAAMGSCGPSSAESHDVPSAAKFAGSRALYTSRGLRTTNRTTRLNHRKFKQILGASSACQVACLIKRLRQEQTKQIKAPTVPCSALQCLKPWTSVAA